MRAVIVGWKRSPFSRAHKGDLFELRPDDLGGQVIEELMRETRIDSSIIDDIIVGCAYPEGEQGYNIGRMMSFMGGLDYNTPGQTINRLCGSSMQSILSAHANIASGLGEMYLCGGIESMSRVKRRGFNWSPNPLLEERYPEAYVNMGNTAENVADSFGITREEQEKFALLSHRKASNAKINGFFTEEIANISHNGTIYNEDGCIRGDTTLETMSSLNPAFKQGGTVTAATSSPLTDGAVFSIICSESLAKSLHLSPMAAIVSGATTGCPPELMGLGPISAVTKVLDMTGWKIDEVDIFEINEAFASQSIACITELGIDINRVNIDGGALAIGHPLGASGARITCKAASLMNRTGAKRAIATMCIGGGMGMAIALESLD